jgi:hypothetical protein
MTSKIKIAKVEFGLSFLSWLVNLILIIIGILKLTILAKECMK